MPSPTRSPPVRGVLLVALAALLCPLGACVHQLVFVVLDPGDRFDEATLPPAPGYDDDENWAAHPDRPDPSDVALDAFPAVAPERAVADAFYLHPTTWLGQSWNAPAASDEVRANTDRGGLLIQASAFNACCAVYAPHYRQVNGQAFTAPSPAGAQALDVAYDDVRRAFDRFVARDNAGRPFVLAAHSQGTVLGARLLRERIAGSDDQARLVAAYLIGGPLADSALGGVPLCVDEDDTGCVVAFNARGPRFVANSLEFVGPLGPGAPPLAGRACVNPLSWRVDGQRVTRTRHRGAVFFDTDAPQVLPAFASAQCRDGTLLVEDHGVIPSRAWADDVLLDVMGEDNFHPIEYQMFYLPLRDNAVRRVAAFLGR